MSLIQERQSSEYRKIQDELLEAEVVLKDQRERVAELRRRLPRSTKIETDYIFQEGPADLTKNSESDFFKTRLSQLFDKGKDELIVDHMMFSPDWEQGCPMCCMWADGYDAIGHHITDKVNFALIARAQLNKLREWGHKRGGGS